MPEESLIETWDVLKYKGHIYYADEKRGFNRNMGCIEIRLEGEASRLRDSLIETWDVLKSVQGRQGNISVGV